MLVAIMTSLLAALLFAGRSSFLDAYDTIAGQSILVVAIVVFAALILGMLAMLIVGIRSDLRVRRILTERLAQEDRDERARIFVDRDQTNLFEGDAEES